MRNFQTPKKSLLSGKKDVIDLMVFSGKKLSSPLLAPETSEQKEMALEVWENLQSYLGIDGEAQSSIVQMRTSEVILFCGITTPEIRSEIYCQLIKQMTKTPDV
jgi:hypothetical protein